MEQINQKEVSQQLFSGYAADPKLLDQIDSKDLEFIVDKYPYCQLLQAFYAKQLHIQNAGRFTNQLARASVYMPDRTVLYAIINHPESLKAAGYTPGSELENAVGTLQNRISAEPEEQVLNNLEDHLAETKEPEPEEQVKPEETELVFTEQILTEDQAISYSDEEYAIDDAAEEVAGSAAADLQSSYHPEEELIPGSIASSDFFAFEEKLNISKEPVTDDQAGVQFPDEEITGLPAVGLQSEVAKYDDDKLPYTFLWWLDKTRKEHADTYQPYVIFKPQISQNNKINAVNELNSQIIENIFHLQSPLEELEATPQTVPCNVKRKEEEIIENFIKEEPQIKAAQPEKLDTENKARKSAEDSNDLVSETLASIYIDQMLFDKAIDTYKKLSLKFPEKSTYFANQIIELEKKIN